MNEIIAVLLSALVSGAISWLITRDTTRKQLEQQKELGELQAKIKDTEQKLQANLDTKVHVSKAQFDLEFEAYRQIWEVFTLMIMLSAEINYINDNQKQLEIYKKVFKSFEKLAALSIQYQPFISENVFNSISGALKKFEHAPTEPITSDSKEILNKGLSEFIKVSRYVSNEIRERLQVISIVP